MNTILLILVCSAWAILILEFFEPFKKLKKKIGLDEERKLKSDIPLVDAIIYTIWKVINCSACFSSHLFWISYLIINGSLFGFILCPLVFFITFLIKEHILTIRL